MPTLLEVARRSGLVHEASSSGRWVKFFTAAGEVYVVEGAWGNSYVVLIGAEPETESATRYLRAEEAVGSVTRLAS